MNKNIYDIDVPLKEISSIIYRIILMVMAIVIINLSNISSFFYIIPILYIFFYNKVIKNKKAFIRLVYDYIFISIILMNYNMNDIISIIFFFLPFINSPNHTASKKKLLHLFMVGFVFLVFINLQNNNYQFDIYYTVKVGFILIVLSIILFLEYSRSLFNSKIIDGYRQLDNINFEKSKASNIPTLYNKLIDIFNKNILKTFFINSHVKYITSIQIKNEKLHINNSSNFFPEISTDKKNISNILTLTKKGKDISNIKFYIGNKVEEKNILIYIPYQKHFIYFIVFFEDNFRKPNIFTRIMVNNYLKPLFKKILQTIKFEEYRKFSQIKNLEKLLSDMKYVSTTNKSLHTLNNEFTPIVNYFKMLDEYDTFSEEKQKELDKKIKKQEDRARISFNRVLTLSETILDKNLNPFAVKNINKSKLKFLYMRLKSLWNIKFEYENIELNIDYELLDNIKFKSDINILEILFLDIIANMDNNTDQKNLCSVKIDINDNDIIINFSNQVKFSPKERKSVINNIQLFNDGDRTQLLLKKGHGFANIKEMVTNLNINCKIMLNHDSFETYIYIPIIKERNNENISS